MNRGSEPIPEPSENGGQAPVASGQGSVARGKALVASSAAPKRDGSRRFWTRRVSIAQAISDRANPVVVKELRQAVQSRLVIAVLLLFLLANVIVVSAFLIFSVDAPTGESAGRDLFSLLFVMLAATCMVFVPLYAAVRLTMERNDSNIDLLFITTIAPAAIIRGKFWSAVALTALIYSACMPFLTFTYLLRGIDLPSIFFALGVAFLATTVAIMLAIFVGSVAGGMLFRILLFGGLLYFGGSAVIFTIFGSLEIARRGLASIFAGRDAWAGVALWLLVGVGVWGLLYLLAVAAVSPRSSNRMFPVRVFLTVCWLVLGVFLGVWSWVGGIDEPVTTWSVASVGLLSAILAFGLAERENWSPRVRRHIPRALPLRLLAWLFYTGSAGGVIWCCALSAVSLLVGHAMVADVSGFRTTHGASDMPRVMLGVLLFAWCYSMSGLFLRRMIAPKSLPLVGTTIGLVLLAFGCALPLLFAFMVFGPNWQVDSLPVSFLVANPIVLDRRGQDRVTVYAFLALWALLGLVLNLSWFRQQWRAFRRYEPKPVAPAASLAEEPPVAHV